MKLTKDDIERMDARKHLLEKVVEKNKTAKKCYGYVLEFFEGNRFKTTKWFFVPNPSLGEMRPIDMILLGRGKNLLRFIEDAREDNRPPDE